jgi:hypothetical protein
LAIQSISIDAGDVIKNIIRQDDDYFGLFSKTPTIQEIRSSFRSASNKSTLADKLVGDGLLNPEYVVTIPPKIGRTSPKTPNGRFGYVPLGNAIENRGKKFTPRER